MSVQNNDVNVEFVVQVPANVNFTGRTVNGALKPGTSPATWRPAP
jgi:hypothetical protein